MIPFSGNPLDRASDRRTDAAWVDSRRRDSSSLILPVWRLQPFLMPSRAADGAFTAGFLRPELAERLAAPGAVCILLGLAEGRAHFALDISGGPDPAREGPLEGLGHFHEMRDAASLLPARDTAILGQAKALIDWHQRHGFCARCGAATMPVDAGYRRVCDACKADHFPRTDPVVIMLATWADTCLIGRGKHFPAGMFSALAGFIEPGETIEEAVRRELFEEAGVRTGRVTYHATQPWPFPSTLMIGCFAEATSPEIQVDDNELSDARWIDRATVRAVLDGDKSHGLWLPPPVAIAHHLLRAWAEG
jgi:NAD+ diphosphatase